MRKVTSVERVEAIIGTPAHYILMKVTHTLDEGCRAVLANSPIAGFGYRDRAGAPHTTLVGGVAGFARVESKTQLSFELPADDVGPETGSGVSFVFLLPGVGETLRLNGTVDELSDSRVVVKLGEAYVHCARCIYRSKLWEDGKSDPISGVESPASGGVETRGPLSDPAVAEFLASAHFAFVSSWDAGGAGDTSPKGDPPGFIRILDGQTLAIPDRRGNKRADTFHNLVTCDQLSIAALAPERVEVLHLSGTAFITDDAAILSQMALRGKPPHAALIVRVGSAQIKPNEAVRRSNMWDRSARGDVSGAIDLNQVAAQHMASNKARGGKAALGRVLSKGLSSVPKKLLRRVMDRAYRKELKDEGYETDADRPRQ